MIAKLFAGGVAVLCLAVVGLSFHCGGFHCCGAPDNCPASSCTEASSCCDSDASPAQPSCCSESAAVAPSACCEGAKEKLATEKKTETTPVAPALPPTDGDK